jgi:hypothetical protein
LRGAQVDATPAKRPQRTMIEGCVVSILQHERHSIPMSAARRLRKILCSLPFLTSSLAMQSDTQPICASSRSIG